MLNFFRLLAGLNPIQFTNVTMQDLASKVGYFTCGFMPAVGLISLEKVKSMTSLQPRLVVVDGDKMLCWNTDHQQFYEGQGQSLTQDFNQHFMFEYSRESFDSC